MAKCIRSALFDKFQSIETKDSLSSRKYLLCVQSKLAAADEIGTLSKISMLVSGQTYFNKRLGAGWVF